LRKQVVQIHSEDLRPIILKNRGGKQVPIIANPERTGWFTQDGYPVLDGNQLEYFKAKFHDEIPVPQLCRQFDMLLPYQAGDTYQPSIVAEHERRFCVLAYVISEKSFPYKNKTKCANRMVLDINGFFTEEMLWPAKDKDTAELGYKEFPVLASFYLSGRGVQLGSIVPLLLPKDLEKYDMI
jgi:hypothetical protein